MVRTTGPYFVGAFNPGAVTTTIAGTGVIEFDTSDVGKAIVNFTIDGQSFVKRIERLPF